MDKSTEPKPNHRKGIPGGELCTLLPAAYHCWPGHVPVKYTGLDG